MRRGLGTADPNKAEALVAQMNEILADESWWNGTKYPEALRRFEKPIVDAFYDGLQASAPDSYGIRGNIIPLPGKDEGYARVLFVGTTGAGKTSLLRHLIGSDPDNDRFPSTSTAKTTVSDIEVIPADGSFHAAVTFFSEVVIQTNIEDCVLNACSAVWEGLTQDKIADRFLHHPDQRFRLSYVLGSWQKDKLIAGPSDEWDFGDGDEAATAAADESVSPADATRLQGALDRYVDRITRLAQHKAKEIVDQLLPDPTTASPEDREAAAEIFQSEIFEDEAFHDIVQDVLEDVLRRFEALEAGELTRRTGSSKWPVSWTFETDDRSDFLRQVRWFSSNFAPSFGRLLTPVVDGIRVQGPLFPTFTDRRAKVVLLDGQGLGHTPDSSSSVTTHVTKRFVDVDAILLVDNAEQPIQAAAQSVLRAVASSGNYAKLAIAFTHFDQVKGLNLPTFGDKRAHVLASVHNYLTKLREVLNAPIVASMERIVDQHTFMIGALQGSSSKLPPGVRAQLNSLFEFFEKSVEPPVLPDAKPNYDPSGLGFAVQRAADSFQKAWAARLGLAVSANLSAEHHTRVKALNRRISNELDVEYDTLRPVADLVGRISEEVSNFLDHPIAWTRSPANDDEVQQAIAPIRQAVFTSLHGLALHRITDEHLCEWRRAMEYKGKGSSVRRASDIRGIYELAAPVPGTVNTEPALNFMKKVRELVREAIVGNGGSMTLGEA
jgi:energy-coupling factor transporter ATP-binding protein EcfA2